MSGHTTPRQGPALRSPQPEYPAPQLSTWRMPTSILHRVRQTSGGGEQAAQTQPEASTSGHHSAQHPPFRVARAEPPEAGPSRHNNWQYQSYGAAPEEPIAGPSGHRSWEELPNQAPQGTPQAGPSGTQHHDRAPAADPDLRQTINALNALTLDSADLRQQIQELTTRLGNGLEDTQEIRGTLNDVLRHLGQERVAQHVQCTLDCSCRHPQGHATGVFGGSNQAAGAQDVGAGSSRLNAAAHPVPVAPSPPPPPPTQHRSPTQQAAGTRGNYIYGPRRVPYSNLGSISGGEALQADTGLFSAARDFHVDHNSPRSSTLTSSRASPQVNAPAPGPAPPAQDATNGLPGHRHPRRRAPTPPPPPQPQPAFQHTPWGPFVPPTPPPPPPAAAPQQVPFRDHFAPPPPPQEPFIPPEVPVPPPAAPAQQLAPPFVPPPPSPQPSPVIPDTPPSGGTARAPPANAARIFSAPPAATTQPVVPASNAQLGTAQHGATWTPSGFVNPRRSWTTPAATPFSVNSPLWPPGTQTPLWPQRFWTPATQCGTVELPQLHPLLTSNPNVGGYPILRWDVTLPPSSAYQLTLRGITKKAGDLLKEKAVKHQQSQVGFRIFVASENRSNFGQWLGQLWNGYIECPRTVANEEFTVKNVLQTIHNFLHTRLTRDEYRKITRDSPRSRAALNLAAYRRIEKSGVSPHIGKQDGIKRIDLLGDTIVFNGLEIKMDPGFLGTWCACLHLLEDKNAGFARL